MTPTVRATACTARAVLGLALALLAACSRESAPTDDFVAVPAAGTAGNPQADARSCPDLRGSFDLSRSVLGASIPGRAAPDTHGLPVVMTFKQGPTNIEGWWVVPRKRLVAFATTMSEDAPKRYASWRGLVLKEHLPENFKQNFDAYLKAVAELGPATPVHAQVVGRRCEDAWMLVDTSTHQVTDKHGTPRSEEVETWLARDAAGALLIRRVTYTLKHYSLWAPSTQSIRTSRHTRHERVEQVDAESAEPLVAADLPEDPLTRPRPRMACADVPAHVNQFSERLKALLPPKTELTRFALNPVRQRDADGNCPFAVVDIEIVGSDPYFLTRTESWLRKEENVDSVEVLRLDDERARANTRRLRVVLR